MTKGMDGAAAEPNGSREAADGGVASVTKALAILDIVGEQGSVSLPEVARATKLPKSTLFRLLRTLAAAGYIERTERGEYAPTVKLWRIGARAIDYSRIHLFVVSALTELVHETTETAHFSIYESGWAVYVEKVEGTHPIHAYTHVGGRSPSYTSATGKALLAFQPAEEIERVGKTAERHTATTICDPSELIEHMARIRETKVAVNRGEWRDGVWGVAAPVFGYRDVVGALGVSGPQDRIEPALDRLAALVTEQAALVTERYGGDAGLFHPLSSPSAASNHEHE
jgi:DNA-binding IclR family transcriptional regulator